MCTIEQQGRGRHLSSARHAVLLQLHRLVTWLSLQGGVPTEVRCCCLPGGERGCIGFFCCLNVEHLHLMPYSSSVCPDCACFLMFANSGSLSNAVDLYNSATGTWSTAQLSVARNQLAAASVGNVAVVAGGWKGGLSSCWIGAYCLCDCECVGCRV
jgi:hypothetical protein